MGGYAFTVLDEDGNLVGAMEHFPAGRTCETATPSDVRYLMEHYPHLIPDLSITSITDRAKSDSFGKALWVAQVLWFYISCLGRFLVEDLPLTLLEIITTANTFYTIASFYVWWYKPMNIEAPTLIKIGDEAIFNAMRLEAHQDSSHGEFRIINPPVKFVGGYALLVSFHGVTTPLNSALVHLFGWWAQFPTPLDKRMWHIATVGLISTSAFFTATQIDFGRATGHFKKQMVRFSSMRIFGRSVVVLLFSLAACLRYFSVVILLVESIRQLFYLPPKAYTVASMSHYFPHFFLMYGHDGRPLSPCRIYCTITCDNDSLYFTYHLMHMCCLLGLIVSPFS